MKCEHCPVSGRDCRAESDPRYSFLCQSAASGVPSRVASVVALSREPGEYPALATQARNLAGSLRDWLKAGAPITPTAERKRRRAVCEGCPLFDAAARRCTVCGCFGSVKPWLATATCPEGKWGDPGKH